VLKEAIELPVSSVRCSKNLNYYSKAKAAALEVK
jgi:hypothetical protein